MSLINLLKKQNTKNLFTTPSHSGKKCIYHKFYQWYKADISEVDAYNPEDALEHAEREASKIYNTKSTHFLTNGSSSGIIASILACCTTDDKILIWEKSHRCHKNGAILSKANIIEYKLKYNEEWGLYEPLSTNEYEDLIKKYKPKALVITSPTYEGLVTNIKELAIICKKFNVVLIVDEAHGALYPFSDKLPDSAISYADFVVQSLHKTAGGINPTALLHNNTNYDVKKALNLITTTSPSYPMLATIEANIKYLNSKHGKKELDSLIDSIVTIKNKLTNLDFYGDDITKILIKKQELSGQELSSILFEKYNIEDEIANDKSLMLLTGIGTSKKKLNSLLNLRFI